MSPHSRTVYLEWMEGKKQRCKDHAAAGRLQPIIHELPNPGKPAIYWIGNRSEAAKVILYFHGGGFYCPLLPNDLEWCWNAFVIGGVECGSEVAVAVLDYSLSPDAKYPLHLCQAVRALEYLIHIGFSEEDVIIGGNSAGGNLTAQLLGHLLHPHGDVKPLTLKSPLAGAFMVSPWLGSNETTRSFQKNKKVDMLTGAITSAVEGIALRKDDNHKYRAGQLSWFAPLDAERSWYQGLDVVIRNLYVTVGTHEVIADHGLELVRRLHSLESRVNIKLDEAAGEVHDHINIEGWFSETGDATRRMKAWFKLAANMA